MKRLIPYMAIGLIVCVGSCLYGPAERSYMFRHAWAAAPTSCLDTIEITSGMLPYTIPSSDTCYCLTANITTTGNGINFNYKDNILLDGNYDTLFFGTDKGDSYYGIRLEGGPPDNGGYDITIKHLTIFHDVDGDTTADQNDAIRLESSANIYFQNCNAFVDGANGHALDKHGSSIDTTWNIWIDSGNYSSGVSAYTSRCQGDGHLIRFIADKFASAGYDYHLQVTNITCDSAPAGITFKGKGFIYGNHMIIDGRNDYYSFPSGVTCWGAANGAAVGVAKVDSGSYVRACTLLAGTTYLGMDEAILIQTAYGAEGNPVYVDSNICSSHFGLDPADGYGTNAKAIKWRWSNHHLIIEHNICSVYVCTTQGTSYGKLAQALRAENTNWDNADWDCEIHDTTHGDTSVIVRYNTAIATAMDSVGFTTAVAAMLATGNEPSGDDPNYHWDSAGNQWYGNILKSNYAIYEIGGAGVGRNVSFGQDTITLVDSGWSNIHPYVYTVPLGDVPDTNIVARDQYYTSADIDTSITIANGDVSLERTVVVYVEDAGSSPVSSADVWMVNAYGDTVVATTTNGSGIATGICRYWKEADPAADSVAFNNFSIGAQLAGDTAVGAFSVAWDNDSLTRTLSETGGQPTKLGAGYFKAVQIGE